MHQSGAIIAPQHGVQHLSLPCCGLCRRPTTAFRLGFPGFTPIPDWTPLLKVPNHPEYPSGHTVTVGAIWEVLLRTLNGKDDVTFSVGSDSAPWLGKRSYTSLKQAAQEAAISRLYGGVHFPTANNDGLILGRTVASWDWGRVKPGSPVVLQTPKDKATSLRKPWLAVNLGK